ncbi:MAG: hypothetical protein J6S08_04415 [Duodenibacillus sp.]|nr:hypothetical protein [Duodenibacillus sp.]
MFLLDKARQRDVGDAFTQLRDNGEVEVVQSVDDLPEEIRCQIEGVKPSKQNKATRNVVYDIVAVDSNVVGKVGTVRIKKEQDGFYNGDIVVPEGRKAGTGGARHLTLNAIKDSSRDHYPDLENKTESGLRSVRDVLKSATRLYRQNEAMANVRYVFYSPSLNEGVVAGYSYEKGVYEVITNTPVRNPSYRWGDDYVSLSGALQAPENEASASSPYNSTSSNYNAEGLRPPQALKGEYIDADYTSEMRKRVVIKRSDNGNIQGLYDPRTGKVYLIADALTDETAKPVFLHELGVHSAYTKNPLKLETQMKMARNMVNNGVAQGNALAIRVKQCLFDAGEIDSMSDPVPMEAAEECMAYLVEEAASVDPLSPFRKWFDK